MTFLVFAALGLALLVPVAGSVFLCVPKWYTKVVSPHVPASPISIDWHKPRWYLAPARWLYMPFVFLVVAVVWLVGVYWHSVMSFIERKCPYTSAGANKHQNNEHMFKGDFQSAFADLWDHTLGRD